MGLFFIESNSFLLHGELLIGYNTLACLWDISIIIFISDIDCNSNWFIVSIPFYAFWWSIPWSSKLVKSKLKYQKVGENNNQVYQVKLQCFTQSLRHRFGWIYIYIYTLNFWFFFYFVRVGNELPLT